MMVNEKRIILIGLLFLMMVGSTGLAQDGLDEKGVHIHEPELKVDAEYKEKSALFEITGFLPQTNYAVSEVTYTVEADQVNIYMTVEKTDEFGATVLVPVEERLLVAPLKAGDYTASLFVNREEVADTRFTIPEEKDQDSVLIYNPRIKIEPEEPYVGEEITIYFAGEFPTPGYVFKATQVSIAESYPEQVIVSVDIKRPESPQPQVITPFVERMGTVTLSGLKHDLTLIVNGKTLLRETLQFKSPEDPLPPEAFDPDIEIVPENPQAGETFSVYITGTYPSSGFKIVSKELHTSDSIPEHLMVDVEIYQTESVVLPVLEPFRELVGRESFPAGLHEVIGTLNGERYYSGTLPVGDREKESGQESSRSMVYTFNEEDIEETSLSPVSPGSEGEYPLGEVKLSEIEVEDGEEVFSDGQGIKVGLDAGEGVLFYASPFQLERDYAFMRIAVRTNHGGIQFGLGGLNAEAMTMAESQIDGSIDVTLQKNLHRYEHHFGWVEVIGKAADGVLYPVIQMVNPTEAFVQIELDNFTIQRIQRESILSLIE